MDALDALVAPIGKEENAPQQSSSDPLDALVQPTKKVVKPEPSRRPDIEALVSKSSNPDETKKKLSLAKNSASLFGMSEYDIFRNAEIVAKRLYGPFENPGSASSKLENTVKSIPLKTKIATLQYQQLRDGETPERAQQIKELQGQVPKDQGGWMFRFVIDAASSLGIQLGAGAVGSVTGMQAFGQGLLSKMWYVKLIPGASKTLEEASKKSLALSDEAVDTAMGSLIGGFYGELRDSGVGVKAAKAASGVMLAAQTALSALSAGKIPGVKQATESLAEASLKAVASGELAKSVAIQAGKGYLEQGAIAAVNSATGVLLPQFAKSLSNKVDGTDLTWDQANVIWNQFATGTLEQALAMGTVHAIGATVQGTRYAMEASKIAGEIDKTVEPSPTEAGGVKVASKGVDLGKLPNPEAERAVPFPPAEAAAAEAKAEAARTKIAKDEIAKTPISQLDVPRGTMKPTGAELASIENAPFERTSSERINDLATLEKNKVITEPQQAELDKLRSEQPAAMVSAKPPSTTERVESDPRMIKANQKVASLQDALDSARKEGKLSGVQDLAMEDALKSARQEARMTQDMLHKEASEKAKQAVTNERARVATLESVHKSIDTLKSVDPDTFDKASGDFIRELKEHFEPLKDPTKAKTRQDKTLDIDALKSALAEAKAAHEDIAPEVEAALQDMPSSYAKLKPDQLEGLVAVIKNLQKVKSLEGKIRTGEGWVKMADLQADAEKSIKPPKGSMFGKQVAKGKRRTTAAVRTQVNGFSMNGEIVMGGEGTAVHKVAIQDVLNSRRDYILERELQEKAARTLLKDRIKIDQQKNPVGWNDYWNKKFTEDGVTLTRAEIMDNYMGFQDENHRESLLNDGTAYSSHVTDEGNPADVEILPESTYQKFFSHLGKNEHDLMNIAIKGEAERGQALSDYHERRYGTPIEVVPNHWRKYVKREGVTYEQDIIDIQKENQHIRINTDEKSLISRTGAKGATYTTGFWDKFTSSINDAALITKMGEAVHNSSRVLNDGKISDKIAKTYGGSILKQLREDLAAEAGQRETPKELERTADALGNIASNVHLGAIASLKVPIKLAGLGFRSLINNPHGFIPGTIETLTHYKAASAAAREFSSLTAEAYKSGGSIDLQQLSQQSAKAGKARAIGKKAQNINMAGTRGGSNIGFTWDATTSRHEAEYQFNRALKGKEMDSHFKAVTQVTEDMVKRGLTPEQKMNAVGRYADSAIGESHAVADPGYKLGLQKTGLGRIITKFKSEPLKGFEQVRRLGMRFAREPSMVNAGKLFTSLAVYGAAEGLLIYGIDEGVNALFGTKSKQTLGETERATDLAMIPMVGDAINEDLYLAQHPWVGAQQGAVESLAVLPLNTILDTAIMHTPGYTPSQKRAASKRVAHDLKSIFNTPISLGARSEQ